MQKQNIVSKVRIKSLISYTASITILSIAAVLGIGSFFIAIVSAPLSEAWKEGKRAANEPSYGARYYIAAVNYINPGSLIKGKSFSSVYFVGDDLRRYVFPNEKTFKTWYSNFSGVVTITDKELASFPLGKNITYRPGIKLVKIESDPKVYVVENGGLLRWITTEALAKELYGDLWNKEVDDIPVTFFTDYTIGDPIIKNTDFDKLTFINRAYDIITDLKARGSLKPLVSETKTPVLSPYSSQYSSPIAPEQSVAEDSSNNQVCTPVSVESCAVVDRGLLYSQFVDGSTYSSLAQAIAAGNDKIYLPPGVYTIANPLVINRTTPLYIHGASRNHVILQGTNPNLPLFQIERAGILQFANLNLEADPSPLQNKRPIAVDAVATSPITMEMIGVDLSRSAVLMRAPGIFRFYASVAAQIGIADPIEIDHPQADFLMLDSDISNMSFTPVTPGPDNYHIRQKRGRVRIYANNAEDTIGRADIRIDTASELGPHIISDNRSEGANGGTGTDPRGYESAFIYVPPSNERVDIVLKNNAAAWSASSGWGCCSFLNYNAAGTVWLIGNNGWSAVAKLVDGDTSKATIVSIGNVVYSPNTLPTSYKALYWGGLVYNYVCHCTTGGQCLANGVCGIPPKSRQVNVDQKLENYSYVPLPPFDELPPVIYLPRMDIKLPGFRDAKIDYGAVGDGITDDSAVLQAALDDMCDEKYKPTLLYIPPGTYRITKRLAFSGTGAGCVDLPYGGFIAGAGSGNTIIKRDPDPLGGGGVFFAGGMSFYTVQGITFKTTPWNGATPREANVTMDFEWLPGQSASQKNIWHDNVFDGGKIGFGAGVETSGAQSDNQYVVNSTIKNAFVGFASGHYNALQNMCHGCRFNANDYTFGQQTTGASNTGGSVHVYCSVATGTRVADIWQTEGQAHLILSARGYTSDAGAIMIDTADQEGNAATLQLEQVVLTGDGGELGFQWGSAGGLVLIDSELNRLGGRLNSDHNASSIISISSTIPDWDATMLNGAHAHKDRIERSSVNACY